MKLKTTLLAIALGCATLAPLAAQADGLPQTALTVAQATSLKQAQSHGARFSAMQCYRRAYARCRLTPFPGRSRNCRRFAMRQCGMVNG
jgi:hypothetical protein